MPLIGAASLLEDASGFWIPTPMAQRLKERLEAWIHCGHTGGVVIGEARLGKTRALKALEHQITNRNGQPIRIFYTHYGLRDVKSIRAVFAKVARRLDYEVKQKTSDTLLEEIVLRLAEAAATNDTRRVALVVDEAQLLSLEQLNAFAEIYNELVDMRVNCSIFFVVNRDQFSSMLKALLREENYYLTERFFNNVMHFSGICSEMELRACLAGYDVFVVSETPTVVASEYFCPDLYKQGWRLADMAHIYWRHFREDYGLPLGLRSWGMAQFIRATNLLLMDYLPQCMDKDDQMSLEACVIKSLEGAGIRSSLARLAVE